MKETFRDILAELSKAKIQGSFAQNVSVVFGGNVLNFILQLIFAPIISRIYGPAAYGEYAYYNLIVTNIVFFSSLSLPSIYILPNSSFEYLALGKMALTLVLSVTLVLTIIFYSFDWQLLTFQGSILAIPLIIVLISASSINGILTSWNTRNKNFRKNSSTAVFGNLFSKGGTIGIGYFITSNGIGLLTGDLIRSIIVFFIQTSYLTKLVAFKFLFANNWKYLIDVFRKHKSVVKYIFPSQLLSKWTADLPIIIIGFYYSKELLGYYTFATTILNIPSKLFENSIRPVMFKKAVEIKNTGQSMGTFLLRSIKVTFGISLIPAFLLALISPKIFPIIFGQEWTFSGKIVVFLSIYYIMNSLITPYLDLWKVLRREKELLMVNMINIIFKIAPLGLVLANIEFEVFLTIFSISSAVGILILLLDLLSYLFGLRRGIFMVLIVAITIGMIYLGTLKIFSLIYN